MSEWNHVMCLTCWVEQKRDRTPCRVIGAPVKPCCFCGAPTGDGIFVRHDPKTLPCKHDEDEG